MKVCGKCGHRSEEYGVDYCGTIPANEVSERLTCPVCGAFYGDKGEQVWCTCPSCGKEITYKMFRAQTGLLPPSGSFDPSQGQDLMCPACREVFDITGTPVKEVRP